MKREIFSVLSFILTIVVLPAAAQTETDDADDRHADLAKELKQWKDEHQASNDSIMRTWREEYDAFRAKSIEEYREYVRKAWKEFKGEPAMEIPEEEQIMPVFIDENGVETASIWDGIKGLFKKKQAKVKPINDNGELLDVGKELSPAPIAPQPQPPIKIAESPLQTPRPNDYTTFNLFGLDCKIRIVKNCEVILKGLEPDDVADAMKVFELPQFNNMLYDCLQVREEHHLSDWAYYQMLQKLVDCYYGKDTNEASLVLSYLYSQSGYKMRMVHDKKSLMMLAACHHTIYGKDYTFADYPYTDLRYYLLDGRKLATSIYICQAKWPKESSMSLQLTAEQEFALSKAPQRTIRSRKNPDFAFTITSNKNYIDFYDTYPSACLGDNYMTRWAMYAETPIEKGIRDQLYPAMRQKLQEMTKVEAVKQILWWTQGYLDDKRTNSHPEYLQYAYDEDIWGTDRAFFGEETLFYPWCDCEDRAILFSHLVRDIVGLDVALVHYPGHLATAVAFTEPVKGDYYVTKDGRHFTVCDPTILGGDIGMTMDDVVGKPATLMILKR